MTVSKELAIKMKEKGFPQGKSYFYYCEDREREGGEITGIIFYPKPTAEARMHNSPDLQTWAAPTASEILAELPVEIKEGKGFYDADLSISFFKGKIEVQYEGVDGHGSCSDVTTPFFIEADTLEEALGEMYCKLKEDGVI